MRTNGPLAPVAVLREAATMRFTCESCEDSGVGDVWMYDHADRVQHDRYRAEPNPWR